MQSYEQFCKQAVDDAYANWMTDPYRRRETGPTKEEMDASIEGLKQQFGDMGTTAKDIGRMAGRGVWNGTNLVSNVVGGELKGLNNIMGYIPEKLDNWAQGTWLEPITYLNALPTRLIDKGLNKSMDKITEWNGLVQDYHKPELIDENSPAARTAYIAGNALPIGASLWFGARTPGVKRIFSPVQPGDVAAATAHLPGKVGQGVARYANWWAKPGLAATTANIASQVGARALPAVDYATGVTHVNPEDSETAGKLKGDLRSIPRLMAALNWSAGANYLINHLQPRSNALAEMAGRSTPLIASMAVDSDKGVLGNVVDSTKDVVRKAYPEATAKLLKWWREPTDWKDVVGPTKQLLKDTKFGVFDPNVDPAEKWKMIRQGLNEQPANKWLRFAGIQPTADNGFGFLNNSSKTDMLDAYRQGLMKTMNSADAYKNALIGRTNRQMYEAGRNMVDQVQKYRQLGDLAKANQVMVETIPEMAERYFGANADAVRSYIDKGIAAAEFLKQHPEIGQGAMLASDVARGAYLANKLRNSQAQQPVEQPVPAAEPPPAPAQ